MPFFFCDRIKKLLVSLAISAPLIAIVVFIVNQGGEWFFIYVWIFLTAFTFVSLEL